MNPEFVAILKKLITEQGKETLLNYSTAEAGVQKAIDKAENITICKKIQIRRCSSRFMATSVMVNLLTKLLAGGGRKIFIFLG